MRLSSKLKQVQRIHASNDYKYPLDFERIWRLCGNDFISTEQVLCNPNGRWDEHEHSHTQNQFRSFVCFSSNKIYRLPSFIADSIHQIHFHELKAFAGDENNRLERQLKSCRSNGSIEYMWRWPFFCFYFLPFFFVFSSHRRRRRCRSHSSWRMGNRMGKSVTRKREFK